MKNETYVAAETLRLFINTTTDYEKNNTLLSAGFRIDFECFELKRGRNNTAMTYLYSDCVYNELGIILTNDLLVNSTSNTQMQNFNETQFAIDFSIELGNETIENDTEAIFVRVYCIELIEPMLNNSSNNNTNNSSNNTLILNTLTPTSAPLSTTQLSSSTVNLQTTLMSAMEVSITALSSTSSAMDNILNDNVDNDSDSSNAAVIIAALVVVVAILGGLAGLYYFVNKRKKKLKTVRSSKRGTRSHSRSLSKRGSMKLNRRSRGIENPLNPGFGSAMSRSGETSHFKNNGDNGKGKKLFAKSKSKAKIAKAITLSGDDYALWLECTLDECWRNVDAKESERLLRRGLNPLPCILRPSALVKNCVVLNYINAEKKFENEMIEFEKGKYKIYRKGKKKLYEKIEEIKKEI